MKKFVFLFASALSAMLLAAPELHAQPILGAPVYLAEEDITGWDVAFEGYSDNTNLGGWLGALDGKSVTSGNGKKLTRFTGEAPLDIVWQLETADADDGYPDVALYYLKNKGTGQYIGVDWNRDESYRFYMVETKEEAARLAFYSATEGGEYGGDVETATKAGVYDTDWPKDPAAITIVDLFRPDGRGFISNEADEKIKGVAWSNTTTNVWVMHRYYEPATGRDYLRELVLSIPSDWEEKYVLHTDPGCIGDSAKYQRFAELYSEAVQYESLDDGRCKEIYAEMNELYEWLRSDESLAPVEDGGYYYFFTANSAFIEGEAGGDFAIYAPDDNKPQYLGWKAFDKDDPRFIWQIKEAEPAANGDKHYSIQNVGTGIYIDRATSHVNSANVQWSDEFQTPSVLISLNHKGQWYISDDVDWTDEGVGPRPFHQAGHSNGSGKYGNIVLWLEGASSPSAWYIKEVPQEEIDRFVSDSRQQLAKYWSESGGNLATNVDTVLDAPGYISSQEVLDNYRAVAAEADTMLNYSTGKTYSNEEYQDVYERLKAASEAYLANCNRPLPDGYYRFQVVQQIYYVNEPSYYMGVVDGRPGWNRMKEADMEHVWKVTRAEGGDNLYYMQNMGNNKYMGRADKIASQALMQFSDNAETPQYILPFTNYMNGQFYIRNGVDTLYNYDTGNHDNGSNSEAALDYYTIHAVNNGTAWGLIPVSEEEFAGIQADAERVELNKHVNKALAEARRLYNRNTVYTYGDRLITDVSQLYTNNNGPGGDGNLDRLIDGQNSTYWKSKWSGNESENATHYLRLETSEQDGFPDSVMCYIEARNTTQYHHMITKYRISASNDTVNWKYLPIYEKEDISERDLSVYSADPIRFVVSGIGGYKYVRFEFLAVKPIEHKNWHPVAQFAEFNLMPVTGVDEGSSLTGRAAYKSVAADLFKAVQKAQAELSAGDATQETADELDKAISAFNSAGVADSIVAMARLNIENLSPGDLVGDFPEEALDAYTEAAEAAIGEYEGAADVSAELIERTVKSLTDAYNELYPSMVKPGDDIWYVLHNKDAAHTAAGEDRILYSNGWYGTEDYSGTSTFWVTSERENISSNPKLHFVFKANGDGTYAIQNAGTGLYLGPESGTGKSDNDGHAVQWYAPASVTIVPFGSGQIGLRMPGGDYLCGYVSSDSTVLGYLPHDGTKGIDTNYAWEIKKTSDEVGYVMADSLGSHSQGSFFGLTEPFDMEGAPSAEFGRVEAYEVVGKETAPGSADSIITAYKLHKVEIGEEVIPAGTPYIYYVDGDGSDEYDADVVYPLAANVVVDSKVTAARDTVNGLLGCSARFLTQAPNHYGICDEDSVKNYDVGWLFTRIAIILPWLVEERPDKSVDKKIWVKGGGQVNGVKDVVAVEDRSELVDVFSVEGVLLRRGVPRADATAGLAKGIYVVGRRKVLVR